jgi:fructose-1,6-bisphosphatase/inositol monophosphatase family enzyme
VPDASDLLPVLHDAASAVRRALDGLSDWGPAGTRAGQYRSDLVADAAAVRVLTGAGLSVLSEESGFTGPGRPLLAVLDPVDGSTNASRGIPWFATSVCVLDDDGPLAAVVVNQATGARFEATRGGGARCDGRSLAPRATTELAGAMVGLSGWPPRHLGWRQYRALGAAALDLCAVASGTLDAYVDCTRPAAHGPWDYLGGMLVCTEAGAVVVDGAGLDLVARGHGDRRSPVAAATNPLLSALVGEIS